MSDSRTGHPISPPTRRRDEDGLARVIDFQAFKSKRQLEGDRTSGVARTFLAEGPFTAPEPGTPGAKFNGDTDLAARIERIKSSISRINQLMSELRNISEPPRT